MKFTRILFFSVLLSACTSQEIRPTLRSVDKVANPSLLKNQATAPKSADEIRKAYQRYLSTTPKSDKSRKLALERLAELEFDVSNRISLSQSEEQPSDAEQLEDERYTQQIKKSVELYTLSLRDYPKAKGNDKILYQLAKAYDQLGQSEKSFSKLLQLSTEYPNSRYYIETQFRIAEHYFSLTDYDAAEGAYTEVIIAPKNEIFYEKALFKRGWSRFKQAYYEDAIDDYSQALTYHNFGEIETLNKSERERFDEYFRAIALTVANLGGASYLHEFFQDKPDNQYLYHTYSVLSDIYLKQERYSDSVNVLNEFIKQYPQSIHLPSAQLKIVNNWQAGGFSKNLFSAIEALYQKYHVNNTYWKNFDDVNKKKRIHQSIKEYVLLMSEYYHSRYQKNELTENYTKAATWYQRYLNDYESYARQDKVYFNFAELLRQNSNLTKALNYYELAAYDDELILDKQSSYLTITLTDKLYKTTKSAEKGVILNKHLRYVERFAELYPEDNRISNIIANATQLAYTNSQFESTIKLASLLKNEISNSQDAYKIHTLKAQAYFRLDQYAEAESAYKSLLTYPQITSKTKKEFTNRLALSIYRQGTKIQDTDKGEAIHHFMRISDIANTSEIAATGMYDGISLMVNTQQWEQTVSSIQRFQKLYPKSKYNQDLTKKLSIAYLNSDQKIKAAEQFEKISSFEKSRDIQMTALWQAAELYESKGDIASAIRSYSKYADTYRQPYAQNMEAMSKLVELFALSKNSKNVSKWQSRILKADKSSSKEDRTDRTNYIASMTALQMARDKNNEFRSHKLVAPFKVNLRRKKNAMQSAVKLFGRASSYGIPDATTESTYAIARIYQDFSQALLNSERPKSLQGEELEQYNILLEDQAFPFEDKAIEFYEVNLSRIKNNIFDDWVSKSLSELKTLFPVKYGRKSKIDGYIETLE
ncbi:tetratricopeptide repeat protein [Aliikangiella marina]|uniref:Tetratricopeptide repeat protein n=1 Tax=Aliikangiella marina TaxID=1712262 RepID=A0A545TGT5_9GAMM|nr:tetratricopeptide repeat protein [Aliikangiella marina]TQV76406.1 tetratricopeptide repeat protein [Aliikangiella marina]